MKHVLVIQFSDRMSEGGPIMYLILICFLAILFFIFKSATLLKKEASAFLKHIDLIKEVSLLGLVLGVFGSLIGLVTALDSIDAQGDVSLGVFSGGVKVTLLTLIFGTFTFIIARIAIIVLKILRKSNSVSE